MSKPTILTQDNLDTRREVLTTLLRHLAPPARVDFLDWVCAFAKLTHPHGHKPPLSQLGPDYPAMAAKVHAALRGDAVADLFLANEVYSDLAGICHQWGTDFGAVLVELESWAKGREPTPPAAAARRLAAPPPASASSPGLSLFRSPGTTPPGRPPATGSG